MNEKRPYLKFADNVPTLVIFHTATDEAKSYPSKFDETKMQYLYFVSATDMVTNTEKEYAYYASERQHREFINKGVVPGKTYELVNRKMPNDKYSTFIVRDTSLAPVAQNNSNELEKYLQDDQVVISDIKTPINANKTSQKDGQTMGMCFKIACDRTDDIEEAKSLTKQYYRAFQELMSE